MGSNFGSRTYQMNGGGAGRRSHHHHHHHHHHNHHQHHNQPIHRSPPEPIEPDHHRTVGNGQHDDLIRYICDAWNQVSEEMDKKEPRVVLYQEDQDNRTPANFEPFNLEQLRRHQDNPDNAS